MMAAHVPAGAVEIGGLGHHLEAVLGVEDLAQPSADDRVIVGDHDADRRGGGSVGGAGVVGGGFGFGHRSHRSAARSRDSRYGARYLATILAGGEDVGASLTSELEPCPPVR